MLIGPRKNPNGPQVRRKAPAANKPIAPRARGGWRVKITNRARAVKAAKKKRETGCPIRSMQVEGVSSPPPHCHHGVRHPTVVRTAPRTPPSNKMRSAALSSRHGEEGNAIL